MTDSLTLIETNKELLTTDILYKKQKESLQHQISLGIIDMDGARVELEMISSKQKKLREKLVLANHITADGNSRSISHHTPTESNPKDYFVTKLPDGRKLKSNTYDGLIDKLFSYYAEGLTDFSINSIFEAAILEKELTENPNPNTILRFKAEFKSKISEEFKLKDIRTTNDIFIKKYIQDWTNEKHPKKKAFLNFKSLLNLIFDYAFSHKIITENPLSLINNKPYLKACDTSHARPEDKIFSPDEIRSLQTEVKARMNTKKYGSYYITGYAMLFAIETGVRVGELCALRWADIEADTIHIHCQQLYHKVGGHKEYYLANYTKNEKGESLDGRRFPLTKNIRIILDEIKEKQLALGIESEYIFCYEDGNWITADAYLSFLRRLCRRMNLKLTNNHALRMSLNSNVFIPLGISVADRAMLLGHSVETNLKFYSHAQLDYLDNARAIFDSIPSFYDENVDEKALGTPGNPQNVINFPKKKDPESLIFQAF